MGWVLLVLVSFSLIGVGFMIFKTPTVSVKETTPIKRRFRGEHDMQRQFKEAYMWACDIFGVSDNVYDNPKANDDNLSILGVEYFTYYYVNHYPSIHYPHMIRPAAKIKDYEDMAQQVKFVIEFLDIVDSMRNNVLVEDLQMFKKYMIDVEYLLTRQFETDTMQLHSLNETI